MLMTQAITSQGNRNGGVRLDCHDQAIRCVKEYRLQPGRYQARADALHGLESELLVFDRDANLFLAAVGDAPAIDFDVRNEQAISLLVKIVKPRMPMVPRMELRRLERAPHQMAA